MGSVSITFAVELPPYCESSAGVHTEFKGAPADVWHHRISSRSEGSGGLLRRDARYSASRGIRDRSDRVFLRPSGTGPAHGGLHAVPQVLQPREVRGITAMTMCVLNSREFVLLCIPLYIFTYCIRIVFCIYYYGKISCKIITIIINDLEKATN